MYPGVKLTMQADAEGGEQLAETFSHLEALVSASDLLNPTSGPDGQFLDSLSFRDFCVQQGGFDAIEQLANGVTRGLLGVDANEISALYMINYFKSGTGVMNMLSDQKDGGQYIRARQGEWQLPELR